MKHTRFGVLAAGTLLCLSVTTQAASIVPMQLARLDAIEVDIDLGQLQYSLLQPRAADLAETLACRGRTATSAAGLRLVKSAPTRLLITVEADGREGSPHLALFVSVSVEAAVSFAGQEIDAPIWSERRNSLVDRSLVDEEIISTVDEQLAELIAKIGQAKHQVARPQSDR